MLSPRLMRRGRPLRTARDARARAGPGALARWRLAAGIMAVAAMATAQDEALFSQPGSRMLLAGRASLWDWSCDSPLVYANINPGVPYSLIRAYVARLRADGAPAGPEEPPRLDPPPSAEGRVRIRVADIDCGNRTMERDLRRALNANRFPEVVYTFVRLRHASVQRASGGMELVLHTAGTIDMAGATRQRNVDARVRIDEAGRLRVAAAFQLSMHEFGVEPPTAMFGLLKARDEVNIAFDLIIGEELPLRESGDIARSR